VVASGGGGAGSGEHAERVLEAWSRLAARGLVGRRRLALFTGVFWSDAEVARLARSAAAQGALAMPFSADFLLWLARADLSISRAGYNTCTNVLELRVRALLVPDPRMSDQAFRAARLAERGLAHTLPAESASVEALCDAIAAALRADAPTHDLDLEGARRTSELLADVGPARLGRS
jgi:predicted glycosyltransferase